MKGRPGHAYAAMLQRNASGNPRNSNLLHLCHALGLRDCRVFP